jgi:hypothetical protein
MNRDDYGWAQQFKIQSQVDLDFVIGQTIGYPVGLQADSPPEFRRRVLAAAVSYQLQLSSIDYALKRYVDPDTYETKDDSLGDKISSYLRRSTGVAEAELRNLHTPEPTFGVFGAEITLYRVPYAIDAARMLSNRGLLLEVLPILRLCVEMMAWAYVAFGTVEEDKVTALKAQTCISMAKPAYKTIGKLYGYLSRFTHWGHVIHGHFIDMRDDKVAVLKASVRYRAMTLALCVIALDVLVEVVRNLYGSRGDPLVVGIQGTLDRVSSRGTYQQVASIVNLTQLDELKEIEALLPSFSGFGMDAL